VNGQVPNAVIVAAARSPIGRAVKGSLRTLRADDMAVAMIRAALSQVSALDPGTIDDIMIGCAQPAGQQGYGIARVLGVLLGLDGVPGVTVESVSHYDKGRADGPPDTKNPLFASAIAASRERAAGEPAQWSDPRDAGRLPNVYLAMGETAENVAACKNVSRARQDEFGARSQQNAQRAIEAGFFCQDITPLELRDGTVVSADDGPRANVTAESLAGLKPAFRPGGTVTAGNCCRSTTVRPRWSSCRTRGPLSSA
jgi:acetyl-CoA C-acetyltransferase